MGERRARGGQRARLAESLLSARGTWQRRGVAGPRGVAARPWPPPTFSRISSGSERGDARLLSAAFRAGACPFPRGCGSGLGGLALAGACPARAGGTGGGRRRGGSYFVFSGRQDWLHRDAVRNPSVPGGAGSRGLQRPPLQSASASPAGAITGW